VRGDRATDGRSRHGDGMIWKHGAVIAAAIVVAAAPSRHAQVAPNGMRDAVVTRMIEEGTQRSHVDADLEYMLDVIGPRLTGSAGMKRANDWTQQKFREYGADRAELEAWKFGVGWTRGPTTVRMTSPQERQLLAVSWAWAPGTDGPLAGDVVLMDARTEADWNRRFAGKLRGKWVMVGPAYPKENPDGLPMKPADYSPIESLTNHTHPTTNP